MKQTFSVVRVHSCLPIDRNLTVKLLL